MIKIMRVGRPQGGHGADDGEHAAGGSEDRRRFPVEGQAEHQLGEAGHHHGQQVEDHEAPRADDPLEQSCRGSTAPACCRGCAGTTHA
jgi:hypothetical protein